MDLDLLDPPEDGADGAWQRRTLRYLGVLAAVMLGYAVLYYLGMNLVEGRQRSFLHSLQVVVETFTTTGFGSDSPWTTPTMNVLVIVMDLTGVALIFLALPVLVFPAFAEAISTTVPDRLEEDLTDHVVICSYTPRTDTLIAELEPWDVDHVVVEPNDDVATALYEDGYSVIGADPESVAGLESARAGAARAVVADGGDTVNTSVILTADEVAPDVRTVSIVDDPDLERYHELAGADVVLSPRRMLGESLARKVTTGVDTDLGEGVDLGEEFEVVELPLGRDSPLVGATLAESDLRNRTGANVIGAWKRGEFETPPDAEAELSPGTVLLVTGTEDAIERLRELALSRVHRLGHGPALVVGHGEVGRTVATELSAAGVEHTVVDRRDIDGVDVAGDATDADVLSAAGVEDARTVVFAMGDDANTEFATLVARDANPDAEILARAQETENVTKMYRAGADYVLSLATVSGRLTASAVLDEEEVLSADRQVEVVRTTAPGLAGQTLAAADVRARTDCTVVAIERDGQLLTNLDPDARIQEGDAVIVAGTDAGTARFTELFGPSAG
jgi:Trk K+ transport system NAD-binding subunit